MKWMVPPCLSSAITSKVLSAKASPCHDAPLETEAIPAAATVPPLELGPAVREIAGEQQDHSEIVVRIDIVGVDGDGMPIVRQRLYRLAERQERIAEIAVSLRRGGLDFHGALVILDRLLVLIAIVVRDAEVVEDYDVGQGATRLRDRFIDPARLAASHRDSSDKARRWHPRRPLASAHRWRPAGLASCAARSRAGAAPPRAPAARSAPGGTGPRRQRDHRHCGGCARAAVPPPPASTVPPPCIRPAVINPRAGPSSLARILIKGHAQSMGDTVVLKC